MKKCVHPIVSKFGFFIDNKSSQVSQIIGILFLLTILKHFFFIAIRNTLHKKHCYRCCPMYKCGDCSYVHTLLHFESN